MIHLFGKFAIEKRCRIVISQPSYRRAWRPAILLDSGKSSDSARLHLTAHLRKKCHLVIHPPNALYATGLIIQLWSSSLALPGRMGKSQLRGHLRGSTPRSRTRPCPQPAGRTGPRQSIWVRTFAVGVSETIRPPYTSMRMVRIKIQSKTAAGPNDRRST